MEPPTILIFFTQSILFDLCILIGAQILQKIYKVELFSVSSKVEVLQINLSLNLNLRDFNK